MPEVVEERVAFIEGRMDEQSRQFIEIRESIASLDARVDRRLTSLEQKLDQRFLWLIGVQVTTLVAIVGSLLAR